MTYMELVSTKYSLLEGDDNWQNRLCYIIVTLHKVLQVNFCHDNSSPFKRISVMVWHREINTANFLSDQKTAIIRAPVRKGKPGHFIDIAMLFPGWTKQYWLYIPFTMGWNGYHCTKIDQILVNSLTLENVSEIPNPWFPNMFHIWYIKHFPGICCHMTDNRHFCH